VQSIEQRVERGVVGRAEPGEHGAEVGRVRDGGLGQSLAARGGDAGVGDPSVGGARPPLDEAGGRHPVDQSGDPAGRERDLIGQAAHRQLAAVGPREAYEHLEPGVRQPEAGLQISAEPTLQSSRHLQQPAEGGDEGVVRGHGKKLPRQ
jgi:hypothetical protein